MRQFLYWLSARLPCRIICEGERMYLERYFLFQFLGFTFYLHRFVSSDPDRGMHDHPWRRAFSIILSGWYIEETAYGPRQVHFFNYLVGENRHRVSLPRVEVAGQQVEQKCWTFFFHRTPKVKEWGFYEKQENGDTLFVPYKYAKEGSQDNWWLKAPKGRDEPRRQGA